MSYTKIGPTAFGKNAVIELLEYVDSTLNNGYYVALRSRERVIGPPIRHNRWYEVNASNGQMWLPFQAYEPAMLTDIYKTFDGEYELEVRNNRSYHNFVTSGEHPHTIQALECYTQTRDCRLFPISDELKSKLSQGEIVRNLIQRIRSMGSITTLFVINISNGAMTDLYTGRVLGQVYYMECSFSQESERRYIYRVRLFSSDFHEFGITICEPRPRITRSQQTSVCGTLEVS